MRFTNGRRALATTLVAGTAALGVASPALADTTVPAPTTPTHHVFQIGGLLKTVFGIFDAVHDQTPAIAAPVIADAVSAGDITQAQADQLTALFAGGTGFGGHQHGVKLAPEQRKVLRDVMAAVLAKLPDIAKPVVDKAVADGDLTQKEADLITKVIGMVASFKPGSFLDPGTTVSSPVTTVQKQVTTKVKKAARHRSHRRHKTRHATR